MVSGERQSEECNSHNYFVAMDYSDVRTAKKTLRRRTVDVEEEDCRQFNYLQESTTKRELIEGIYAYLTSCSILGYVSRRVKDSEIGIGNGRRSRAAATAVLYL